MQPLFEKVMGERVDLGFYVLAQKRDDGQKSSKRFIEGKTKNERHYSLLRCPVDKGKVALEQGSLHCQYNHQYPIRDGFPVMLANEATSKSK